MKRKELICFALLFISLFSGCKSDTANNAPGPAMAISIIEENLSLSRTDEFLNMLEAIYDIGCCDFTINDTYIYFYPMGELHTRYTVNSNNVYTAHFSSENMNIKLSELEYWINNENINGVSMSLQKNLEFVDILTIIDFLNDLNVHYLIGEDPPNINETIFVERGTEKGSAIRGSGQTQNTLP